MKVKATGWGLGVLLVWTKRAGLASQVMLATGSGQERDVRDPHDGAFKWHAVRYREVDNGLSDSLELMS